MPVLVAKMTIIGVSSFATDTGRKTPVLAEKNASIGRNKCQYWQKMPEICLCDGGLTLKNRGVIFTPSCLSPLLRGSDYSLLTVLKNNL